MNNTYCIFSALYFPHMGGVEKYTGNLARELSALGNNVVIVTNNTCLLYTSPSPRDRG